MEGVLDRLPQIATRLAALGEFDPKIHLRLSNRIYTDFEKIRLNAKSGIAPAKAGFRFGANVGIEIIMLRAAMMSEPIQDGDIELVI